MIIIIKIFTYTLIYIFSRFGGLVNLCGLCCCRGDLGYTHCIFDMEYGAILFAFTECMTAQMFRVKWFREKIGACIFLGFLPHNSINRNPLFLEGMSGFCPFPDFAAGWWELAGGCIKPTVAVYSVWCIKPTRGSVYTYMYSVWRIKLTQGSWPHTHCILVTTALPCVTS